MNDEYPEHHRLGLVAETSHEIGQFIDWLHEKGMCIAEMDREYGQFWPRVGTIESLLADYFEIDLKKIEREKRAMLDSMRAMNEAGRKPKEFDGEPVRDKPCSECPWRKKSIAGWLGPLNAKEWIELAHSDAPIVCHKTVNPGGLWSGALQCAGAASYRANVCKQPRDKRVACDPRSKAIFQRPQEFLDHHNKHENGETA